MTLSLTLTAIAIAVFAESPLQPSPGEIPFEITATTNDAPTEELRANMIEAFEREGIFSVVEHRRNAVLRVEIDGPVRVVTDNGREALNYFVILTAPGISVRNHGSCFRDELWECSSSLPGEAHDIVSPPLRILSDEIYVEHRNWYVICTGACGEYRLAVRSNGLIEVNSFWGDPRNGTVRRYIVGPERVRRFQSLLARYKPTTPLPKNVVCPHSNVPMDNRDMILPGRIPLFIKWAGNSSAEMVDCGEPEGLPLRSSLYRALREIRIWPTGDVICHHASGEEDLCDTLGVIDAPTKVPFTEWENSRFSTP